MNKAIKTLMIVTITFTLAFFLGRETAPIETKTVTETVTETKYITTNCETDKFMSRIIDFNTDGTELSVILDDGTEWYAYREPYVDVYKGNRIVKVSNGFAYKLDGNSYKINP